uniref:Golgin subfamily A member 1 n=1 Tax=Mola mola TaxID=94237 RepID=A0A3Q3WIV0_MOLML
MFAKLKKKIAEESAAAPRSSIRIPRAISKESITSVGADSGDDFASDGSSSRDDMPAQLLRRNDQIRKLEAKLSDYAEQLRIMRKTKDKLEIALEKHQDSSIKKLQEKNESYQVSRTRMAERMALALEKKDQEWMEKMAVVENEKAALSARLEEMMEQRLTLFQKRDYLDDLEGFQQQELAKIKNMKLKSEPGTEVRETLPESRTDKQERVCPDPLPPFTVSPPTSYCMVTNTADLNDSREINLEYLKHVVLKFMSSREAEAFQLIRAVSVLLNFTREEEELLKQTLEYKMSWFGSKPSPKGIIRPSASGTLTHWN